MTSMPPGWYPAPGEPPPAQRWWDGTQWTDIHKPAQSAPRSKAPWIALIVVTVVVLPALGIGATVVGGAIDLAAKFDETQDIFDANQIYQLRERAGYDELVGRYETVQDSYRDMHDSGEIFTVVPNTAEGESYYTSFMDVLARTSRELQLLGGAASTDPQELDDQIVFLDDELTELVRKFEANEGLDDPPVVVDHNGTTVVTEGSALTPATDEAIDFVAAYQGQPDAAGSYAAAASAMIEPFGMYLSWVNGTGQSACTSSGSSAAVLAYYCNLEPQIIYINQTYSSDTAPKLLDTVRHELAHHLIAESCGVTSPPVAGGRNEAVANSFALLYLGMSESSLSYQPDNYQVDDASRAAAEAIRQGDCN